MTTVPAGGRSHGGIGPPRHPLHFSLPAAVASAVPGIVSVVHAVVFRSIAASM
jgi:hypothetical protein